MNRSVTLLLVLLASPSAFADGAGEQFVFLDQFVLGENNFADVQHRLGDAAVTESGDAGDYSAAICFVIPTKKTVLRFTASELGGSEHFLGGLELVRGGADSSAKCRTASIVPELTVGGLYLGMTKEDFRRVVDPLGSFPANLTTFTFTHKRITHGEEFDVIVSIDAWFESDLLVRLRVSKTATN